MNGQKISNHDPNAFAMGLNIITYTDEFFMYEENSDNVKLKTDLLNLQKNAIVIPSNLKYKAPYKETIKTVLGLTSRYKDVITTPKVFPAGFTNSSNISSKDLYYGTPITDMLSDISIISQDEHGFNRGGKGPLIDKYSGLVLFDPTISFVRFDKNRKYFIDNDKIVLKKEVKLFCTKDISKPSTLLG